MSTRVLVKYVSAFRAITGISQEELTLSISVTLNDLIDVLISKYGPRMKSYLLLNNVAIQPETLILVDGKNVS